MIYFICWVVFLLTMILAVVVVGLKNRKPRPVAPMPEGDEEVMADAEDVEMVDGDEFAAVPAEGDDFGGGEFVAEGGDDFAAFEDEFK
jgi:hypothetical protein